MALGDLTDPPAFDDSEVFIRRFKDPATRVRFMPASGKKMKGTEMVEVYGTEAWPSELVHFNRSVPGGMAVCIAPHGGTCGACSDPDPKVRKRSRAWFFNALDDEGNVRIYTMGIKLKELLEAKESRHPSGPKAQPLSMRDYIIYRIKGSEQMDVTYDPDAQDPSEIDFSDVEPIPIVPVLEKKVQEVHDFYFGADDGSESEAVLAASQHGQAAPVTATRAKPAGIQPKGAIQPAKKGAITPKPRGVEIKETSVAENMAEYGTPDPDSPEIWGDHPTMELIESADTPVIKAWLDAQEVEYPSRAARARLISLAVEKAGE
jgi:hypothetical protein